MNTKRKFVILLAAAALLFIAMIGLAWPVKATHVEPVFVEGNRTCSALVPGTIEFKVEPVVSGVYSDGVLEVDINVRDTEDGQVFDWLSNIGVDAVFVKGGPDGNLYRYDDPPGSEETFDTDLHAPVNPSNNKFFGLSHISFCYDLELEVTKDAITSFTRTFNWTVEKSVTPETWDLFSGDSGASRYTIEVTKDAGVDSLWAVAGTITIFNPASIAADITGVTDEVNGIVATVDCGGGLPLLAPSG